MKRPAPPKKFSHGGARKGAGRKPIGTRAMTPAERKRRQRSKHRKDNIDVNR